MSGKMDKPKIVMPGHLKFFDFFQEFWLQSLRNGFGIISILVIKNFYNCFVTFNCYQTEKMEKEKNCDAGTKMYVYACPDLYVRHMQWNIGFFFKQSKFS